jgi:hypothetical protein
MALATILQAVPPDILSSLAVKETMKEAWEVVEMMGLGLGAECVWEAKAQMLRMEFEAIHMKESETTNEFAMKLLGLTNNLQTLGDNLEEETLVKKFLHMVTSKYIQIVFFYLVCKTPGFTY